MKKELTEKQMHTRLNRHYKKYYGELDTDEWFVNPADNTWKFVRNGETITLVCDVNTGEVTER